MDSQAQDRAHRIGQKNEVRVFRLITNSFIEEKILARATDKKNLNGLVVEAGKFNSQNASGGGGMITAGNDRLDMDESREMMEILLKEWKSGGGVQTAVGGTEEGNEGGEEGGEEAEVPDDDQLNELMAVYDGWLIESLAFPCFILILSH